MKFFCSNILFCFFALISHKVLACRCHGKRDLLKEYTYTDAVFIGKVISVKSSNNLKKLGLRLEPKNFIKQYKSKKIEHRFKREFKKINVIKVKLIKRYKGEIKTKIIKIYTENNSCQYYFQKNKEYIIYADIEDSDYINLKPNIFWTNMCYRTMERNVNEESSLNDLNIKSQTNFDTIFGKRHEIYGDFNGDGITDTLCEHFLDPTTKKETFKYVFSKDSTISYSEDQSIKYAQNRLTINYLSQNNTKTDTLIVGGHYGFYYIKNIGDVNSDKTDEIALIYDYADYSNLNSCFIYSIINDKWVKIYQFKIHESMVPSYNFEGELINSEFEDPVKKIDENIIRILEYYDGGLKEKQITF